MRAFFVSAQLGSHLDWGGFLSTAAELAARGHDVLWVSGGAVAEQVQAQGVSFRPVAETGWRWPPPPPLAPKALDALPAAERPIQRQLRALDQWLDPARVRQALAELDPIVQEFQPDLVVGEMFMAAAALAAERHARPFVVAGWPAPVDRPPANGADPVLAHARQRLARLLEAEGLTGVNWTRQGPPALCSPYLHLSYWSPTWFAGIADTPEPRPLPYGLQTVHVGGRARPSFGPDPTLPDPEARPWVLITLGTIFNQDAAFFHMAAQAVVEVGGLPIIAAGAPLDTPWVQAVAAGAPAVAEIRAWVDLDTVLPYTTAAIHHGGAGTTHALITHAIPQIVVPHAADQMRQAHGVARTQIGVGLLPKNTSTAALARLLAQLMPDRAPVRAQAARLQAEFAALGGAAVAADHLVGMAEKRKKPRDPISNHVGSQP